MHKFKTLPRPQNNSFHTLNLNICKTRKCNFGGFNQLNQFNIFLNPSQRRNFSIFNWRKKDEEDIINTPVIPPDNNSTKEEKEDENLMKALSKHIEISDLAKTPEVYKYLPIADHPLVPNYPIHLSVTKNQFDVSHELYFHILTYRNLHNIWKPLKLACLLLLLLKMFKSLKQKKKSLQCIII